VEGSAVVPMTGNLTVWLCRRHHLRSYIAKSFIPIFTLEVGHHSPLCHLDRSSEGAYQQPHSMEAQPPLCHLYEAPKERISNHTQWKRTPPFVISTGAPKERSGEICGPAVLSWECFSTERTRISYFALPATTTCAALPKESRM
jgi:hypothetical protein